VPKEVVSVNQQRTYCKNNTEKQCSGPAVLQLQAEEETQ
jgi:hypothetical protein